MTSRSSRLGGGLAVLALGCLLSMLVAVHRVRGADDDLSQHEQDAFKAAVDRITPSVVKIETIGGLEHVGGLLIGTGPTTGLAVSADGYIVSSAFNFVQKPAQILVQLDDNLRLPAKLVATDHSRMIVLIKVKMPPGKSLALPTAAPKAEMAVGQWSIAVGRTYDGAKPSLSVGIISAVNRVWGRAVQTDAKVSPNNYGGPLVDIRGRVLGVLVPMSPMAKANDELAGVEWYDSGIGFAVPLEDINRALPRLEKGTDLYPGLLGISMKPGDMFADPPEIAAVQPNSPAYHAGIKAKDTVVEIEGHAVATEVQLKHQLGPRYGGDKVRVVVLRGKDRIEKTIELTDKLTPYVDPFMGILPMRPLATKTPPQPGVAIRYVYPDSPAGKAGLKPGDRITALAGKPLADLDEALAEFASLSAHDKTRITVRRGSETLEIDLQLATLPETVPPSFPRPTSAAGADPKPVVGIVPIRIPEVANKCIAYVPANYNPQVPCGVVIWLHAAGGYKDDDLVAAWKDVCARHDLILLAPKSNDPARWQKTELSFIRKTLDEVVAKYHVDRNRIVVAGQEGGGRMTYLLAQANRDWIRGVVAVESAMPAGTEVLPNDPVERLAFYIARSDNSPAKAQIEATIKALRASKYPVTLLDLGPVAHALSAPELTELARWIDALDRL